MEEIVLQEYLAHPHWGHPATLVKMTCSDNESVLFFEGCAVHRDDVVPGDFNGCRPFDGSDRPKIKAKAKARTGVGKPLACCCRGCSRPRSKVYAGVATAKTAEGNWKIDFGLNRAGRRGLAVSSLVLFVNENDAWSNGSVRPKSRWRTRRGYSSRSAIL